MSVINFIEKHKFGILGTIALHMIIFIWLNVKIVDYGAYQPKEKVVAVLDYTNEETIEEQPEEMLDENGNPVSQNVTNAAADASQDKTTYTDQSFSKSQTDKAVWDELKALEANEYSSINAQKDKNVDVSETDPNEDKNINQNLIKEGAETNENASFGADVVATAKYYLKDRKFLRKEIPSYKCRTEGIVRVTIKVNQKGQVISRTIDEGHTNTQNECLRTEALNYSKKWVFEQNFNDLQRKSGWIEFRYMAQ